MKPKVYSINLSKIKGVSKTPVDEGRVVENFGFEGDAHAQGGIKQVSLLAIESIKKQKECVKVKKEGISLGAGDFAENITTEGVELFGLKVGQRLKLGRDVILEISKIGKDCHKYCAIYYKIGDCIMPREGIFAKVLKAGAIKKNDTIEVIDDKSGNSHLE